MTTMTATPTSRRSLFGRLAPIALILLASGSVHAQQTNSLVLSGSAEVPPVTTSAAGSGQIVVQADRSLSGTIKTSGMVPTAAHIHEAAAGRNGPPIVTLSKGSDGSFSVPAGAKLNDAQHASYLAGQLYVNVHSAAYPDGEIRGQLMRTEAAGEPKRSAY